MGTKGRRVLGKTAGGGGGGERKGTLLGREGGSHEIPRWTGEGLEPGSSMWVPEMGRRHRHGNREGANKDQDILGSRAWAGSPDGQV